MAGACARERWSMRARTIVSSVVSVDVDAREETMKDEQTTRDE